MKPEKLIICGWGPYRNQAEIDFEKFGGQGLFLVTGATGAGKTTIFDTITYALYGSLSGEVRDKEKNGVRSDFADADTQTFVDLQMTHGGKRYFIRRNPEYLRPKKRSGGAAAYTKEKENAVLRTEDGTVIEGVKEVNAYVRELLALDYSQFKQLSMIAQGEFAKLLTAPPRDKTRIFREIFGTGVYDRFTSNLSAKARQQYVLIMEQKHKLEEAVRLLAPSIEKTGVGSAGGDIAASDSEVSEKEESAGSRFLELIAGENWNYEGIEKCLEDLMKETKASLDGAEAAFENIEETLLEKQTVLTRKQEENKRIRDYQTALADGRSLLARKDAMDSAEAKYRAAVNAGWVESGDVRLQNAKKQLLGMNEEERTLASDLVKLKEELKSLMPVWEKREVLEQKISQKKQYEEEEQLKASLEGTLKKKQQEESETKEIYLQKEQTSLSCKEAYEEAVLMQRRAAIGIAVSMLKEGVPCPVCGSLEHPAPAKVSQKALSEEELKLLKQKWEKSEAVTREYYEKVLVLQTQIRELEEKLIDSENKIVSLKAQFELVTDALVLHYLSQKADISRKEYQKNCEKVQKLQVILQEKNNRYLQLQKDIQKQELLWAEASEEFGALLVQYGFTSEEEYHNAYMKQAEREKLAGQIEDYRNKVTANRKLTEHLKENISSEEVMDLSRLEKDIRDYILQKDSNLKNVKKWEQLLAEIKKTRKELHAKRLLIEQQSREYGYIKELENIATGNNAKKLVFEQYVLAGYFEEILHAANIRFRKMTSGRYEMHRTKEVGDGRVKDNLEIQVLDYYTGKYRSVRTLSGGESFKASLSLALGLSDVIQAMSGGIKVEALFIDEGFGSLDAESLDQACETLLSLVESDRLIGIISHVGELRERISKQIVIDKSGCGSTLKVVTG